MLLLVWIAPPSRGADEARPAGGFPDTPDFFPLAVWLQAPHNAGRYKAIGINTYVGLWKGPTDAQLAELEKAGLYVVCHQSADSLKFKDRKVIAAWMHGDEPDNAQPAAGGGYGPPIPPEKIIADYRRIKSADPNRPVLLNLGQGVAWDKWYGRGVRGNHPEDYPEYVKGCDIASFDIYPVTHTSPDVAGKLWYVGQGVRRLAEWTGGRKPVWACIETTHISNPKARPTPEQVRSEVWMAIANGASGIVYFCHEFKPKQVEAGLLQYPEIVEAIKAVNAEVGRYAPVIHSRAAGDVSVASAGADRGDSPVATLCRRQGDATYVFAVSRRGEPARVKLKVAGVSAVAPISVEGEARNVPQQAGSFEDDFEPYGVHVYKIAGGRPDAP